MEHVVMEAEFKKCKTGIDFFTPYIVSLATLLDA